MVDRETDVLFIEETREPRFSEASSIEITKAMNRRAAGLSTYDVDSRPFRVRSFPRLSGRTEPFRIVALHTSPACRLLSPLQASEGGPEAA